MRLLLFLTAVLFVALPAVGADEPDLSTPDAAFDAYTSRLQTLEEQFSEAFSTRGPTPLKPYGYPVFTEELVEQLQELEEERAASRGGSKVTWEQVDSTTEGETAIVTAKRLRTMTRRGEERVRSKLVRFHYELHEGKWLLTKQEEACRSCDGSGECRSCRDPENDRCRRCEKAGRSACQQCEGSGWRDKNLITLAKFSAVPELESPEPVKDTSSAEGVVRTYHSLEQAADHRQLQHLAKVNETVLASVDTFWVEAARARVRNALEEARKENAASFAARSWKIVEQLETDDGVVVVVEESSGVGDRKRTERKTYLATRTGLGWLIADAGEPCRFCDAKGECDRCQGTGAAVCPSCKDPSKPNPDCERCQGTGRLADEECRRCDGGRCTRCGGKGIRWSMAERARRGGKKKVPAKKRK